MNLTLIVITVAAIGVLAKLLRREIRSKKFLHEHRMQLAEENEQLRRQLDSIVNVIARSAGGVEKRISELQEIVTAITTTYPALLEDEPGLLYWLSASDQFYKALRSAAYGEDIFMKETGENQDDHDSKQIVDAFFARIKTEIGS